VRHSVGELSSLAGYEPLEMSLRELVEMAVNASGPLSSSNVENGRLRQRRIEADALI
jgi:hypothetical protein